jgi:hypothetical protein
MTSANKLLKSRVNTPPISIVLYIFLLLFLSKNVLADKYTNQIIYNQLVGTWEDKEKPISTRLFGAGKIEFYPDQTFNMKGDIFLGLASNGAGDYIILSDNDDNTKGVIVFELKMLFDKHKSIAKSGYMFLSRDKLALYPLSEPGQKRIFYRIE